MVQINFAQKQVSAKIVYYGPGMSGKTTNLEVVHQKAPDQNKGELTSISTDGDRTLFFDFMPLDLGTVAGMRTSFQIYTVPGQVYYNSTRKLVLQGVDGVVFVADSSASMVQENLESLRNLEENLNEYGKSLATLPHVIQFNKRDLPDALPLEELNRLLNPYGAPCFEAVASSGHGVFPTLKALAARVLEAIHATGAAPSNATPIAASQRPATAAPAALGTTGFHAPAQAIPAPMPQRASVPTPLPVASTATPALAHTGFHAPAPARPLGATGFHPSATTGGPMGTPSGGFPGAIPMHPGVQPQGNALGMAPQAGYPPQSTPAQGLSQTSFHAQAALAPNAPLNMAMRPSTLHPGTSVPTQQRGTPASIPTAAPVGAPQASAPRSGTPLDGSRFRPRTAPVASPSSAPVSRVQVRPAPAGEGSSKLYVGLFIAAGVILTMGLTYVVMSFL